MNPSEQLELQDRIVMCLADAIDVKWDYFLVNFEVEEEDEGWNQNCLFLHFTKEAEGWEGDSSPTPHQCCSLLLDLFKGMANENNRWGSCTLEADSTGKYRFSFSYEPPMRLRGIDDDVSHFENYKPRPLDS